jgi:photosystem II stability/assembly factor-like uncharacterized protein
VACYRFSSLETSGAGHLAAASVDDMAFASKMTLRSVLNFIFVLLVSVSYEAYGASIPRNEDWHVAGPYGGSATAVAINQKNPKVLLAGARQSLLYKTDDGGTLWSMLPFPKRTFGEVGAILIDPLDQQHYLVGLVGALDDAGLFESADGGDSWKAVPSLSGFSVRALASSASDPTRFVAGTSQGVSMSTDSGRTWTRISDPGNLEMLVITAVAIDPKNPDIIYAGTAHLPWKTTDSGKTWQSIHTGMIDDSDVFSIYIDPKSPDQVFASACSGVYRSGNGGEMWRKLMGIPNTHRRTHVVRQDPEEPGTLYAGTTLGLFKSTDYGGTWHQVNDEQVNSLAFDPLRGSDIYLALEDQGLWKSDDRGKTLLPMNTGFVARRLTAVTLSGNRLVAIQTKDGDTTGVFTSEDDGSTWSKMTHVEGLDGVHLSMLTGVPGDKKLLFAATPRELFRSVDGGMSWSPLTVSASTTNPGPMFASKPATTAHSTKSRYPVHPRPPERTVHPNEFSSLMTIRSGTQVVLLASTNRGILRSLDKGNRWAVTQSGYADDFDDIYRSPIDDGRLVARSPMGVYYSHDFGENWKSIPFPFPSRQLTDFAVPPVGTTLPMLAATVHGLYTSRDEGQTWYSVTSGLPVSTVKSVIYSTQGFVAYAVLYGQLYQSKDGGASWSAVPSSFHSLSIRQLWQPAELPDRLFAVTNDIGILFRSQAVIR